jgi:hypothetical protein
MRGNLCDCNGSKRFSVQVRGRNIGEAQAASDMDEML